MVVGRGGQHLLHPLRECACYSGCGWTNIIARGAKFGFAGSYEEMCLCEVMRPAPRQIWMLSP